MIMSDIITETRIVPIPIFRLKANPFNCSLFPGSENRTIAGIGSIGMILLIRENNIVRIFPNCGHIVISFNNRREIDIVPVSVRIKEGKAILSAQFDKTVDIRDVPVIRLSNPHVNFQSSHTFQMNGVLHHIFNYRQRCNHIFPLVNLLGAAGSDMPRITLRIILHKIIQKL